MKKKQSRIFLIIAGLLTASVILFSQLFYTQASTISKKEVKTEQNESSDTPADETPDDLVISSAPSISIPSSSTIEVDKEQTFIFEILFEQAKTFPHQVHLDRSLGKFFQHLFRVIISPNAP